MEGIRREEGCRNFWKSRASGLNEQDSLDLRGSISSGDPAPAT